MMQKNPSPPEELRLQANLTLKVTQTTVIFAVAVRIPPFVM